MRVLLVSEPCVRLDLPGEYMSTTVALTEVNWEREVALVIDMGERRTGGYRVEVTHVRVVAPDQIELQLHTRQPAAGAFVTQALTRPYCLWRLPRTALRPGEITVTAHDQTGAAVIRQVVQL